jgi:hypothetical protein
MVYRRKRIKEPALMITKSATTITQKKFHRQIPNHNATLKLQPSRALNALYALAHSGGDVTRPSRFRPHLHPRCKLIFQESSAAAAPREKSIFMNMGEGGERQFSFSSF